MKRICFMMCFSLLLGISDQLAARQKADTVFYFRPGYHLNPEYINQIEDINLLVSRLTESGNSEIEELFAETDSSFTTEMLDFQIEYLNKIKNFRKQCTDSDLFGQQLLAAYLQLLDRQHVRLLSKKLYPDEKPDAEKEILRKRMQYYFDSVSNVDEELARNVWAENDSISLINAMGQFFGMNSIFHDFISKAFGNLQERRLYSVNEVIRIHDHMAYIQLYWQFDTKDKSGQSRRNNGRETLLFEKKDNIWKLIHVHYSGMPAR